MPSHRAPQAKQAPAARKSGAPAPTPHAEGATGAPLPQAMRRQMEEAFGASFGGVRLDVSRSAEARGARAFAQGSRITVAPGEWSTGGRSVSRLIAHELAHVQQQRAGRVPGKGGAVNADAALEAEADAAAERVVNGSAANVRGGNASIDTAAAPVQLKRAGSGSAPTARGSAPRSVYSQLPAAAATRSVYDQLPAAAAPRSVYDQLPAAAAPRSVYGQLPAAAAPRSVEAVLPRAAPRSVYDQLPAAAAPRSVDSVLPRAAPSVEAVRPGVPLAGQARPAEPAPAKRPLSAKAASLAAQKPGNAAGVGPAAPIQLPAKYANEQNVVGWRAFYGATEEEHQDPNRIAFSQREDRTVTRHFSPQEQAARTLRPQGGALVGGIARLPDGSLPKSTYAMSPAGTSVADGGRHQILQSDHRGLAHRTVNTHHSSMFNGGDVLHAGHIATNAAGKVNYLDNDSGHYRPGPANMRAAFDTLHGQGVLDPHSTSGRVNFVDASATKGIAGSGSGEGEASVHFEGYRQAGGNEAAIRARMKLRAQIEARRRPGE